MPQIKMVKQIVFVESSQKLGKTPRAASNKLSALLTNRLFTAEAIFISVIRRPRNKSFLTSISDSTEFNPETCKRNFAGANCGT